MSEAGPLGCVYMLSELTDNEIINPTLIDYGMSCVGDEEEVYWIITHDDFIRVNFLLCYFLKEEPANSFSLCRKDLLNFFLCEALNFTLLMTGTRQDLRQLSQHLSIAASGE